MANRIEELRAAGESVWLDSISRGLITSGELKKMIDAGWVQGITSNPTIFEKAISGSSDYDEALGALAGKGLSPYEAFLSVGGDDIRLAADVLRPVYDAADRADGFVSFEVQAASAAEMTAEAKRMWALVDRPNLMIKIPGVPEGVSVVEELIAGGINVNVTLLFEVEVYDGFAEAYIKGLERRLAAGQDLKGRASVASFFVSRVDTKVDNLLPPDSPLRGKVAIANARRAYALFQKKFSGERWERLAAAGARVQRPLWASTGTKNPAYSDVLYVEDLVAPMTVNTMPEPTLQAFLDHGHVRQAVLEGLNDAERVLADAAAAGIDLHKIGQELLKEGLASFNSDFEKLLAAIAEKTKSSIMRDDGSISPAATAALTRMQTDDVVERIWRGDYTVWKPDPTEITEPNRLGFLTVIDQMRGEAEDLQRFAEEAYTDGLRTAVVLGMGGSSLAPEVFYRTFGTQDDGLELRVLDTTVPADILAFERSVDIEKTLFIVASKSGTTIETTSQLAYFWEKLPRGHNFIAITDPGTQLAATGQERGFRRVFLNPPTIGGRYSALSYFGLVPAALIGADLTTLLDKAQEMAQACHDCEAASTNPGARLGAAMATAALNGHDKLTLVLPKEIEALAVWIEQLLAESTGKEGRGIVPIVNEPLGSPELYGTDRLFVSIGDNEALRPLEAAGQEVVRLPYLGKDGLGAEMFRWMFATAVAGHLMSINPFDQPNVQQAKDVTSRILERGQSEAPRTKSVIELLQLVRPGDYVSILAYLPRTDEVHSRMEALRLKLRDRLHVATTSGFGPRYLHSTGQIHKGGPNTGVFLELVADDAEDVSIPGKPYSFAKLKNAQADGDLETLLSLGRRAARTKLEYLEEALR